MDSLGYVEPSVKYQFLLIEILTISRETGHRTVSEGQFDWGGFLPNCNGGVRRFPQHGRQSCVERIGKRELDCETYMSSRCESRTK